MKIITVFFTILLCLSLFSVTAYAEEVSFRTVVSRNDMTIGGEFHLDLQIKITTGISPRTLNSLTVDVHYGSELTEWGDDFPGTNWAFGSALGYSRSANKNTGYYRVLVTGNSVGQDGPGVPSGWDVTTSWQTIVTLRWTINTLTSVNIYIADNTDAAAYFNNYNNNPKGGVTDWDVINEDLGDVSLPVQLADFSAETGTGCIILKWTTESEVNNVGFEVYKAIAENADYLLLSSYGTNDGLKGHGNSTTKHDYSFIDELVVAGQTYWYKVADIDHNGKRTFHGPISATLNLNEEGITSISPDVPTNFKLYPNFPNPFNPSTTLQFDIPSINGGIIDVKLVIYNSLGQVVKTVFKGQLTAGRFRTQWDGRTDRGHYAPSGIYFAVLIADYYQNIIKMMFIR